MWNIRFICLFLRFINNICDIKAIFFWLSFYFLICCFDTTTLALSIFKDTLLSFFLFSFLFFFFFFSHSHRWIWSNWKKESEKNGGRLLYETQYETATTTYTNVDQPQKKNRKSWERTNSFSIINRRAREKVQTAKSRETSGELTMKLCR